jgi:NADPH-dependent 2,4-dienoyl-CoA reductase/sulfur reductase-like enzyme/nitrite reductase/ring-hydroxylating ferredoxin subunit
MGDVQWQKVAAMEDLHDGVPTSVKLDGKEVLLVRVGESLYATRGKCPHYGGPLKKGLISGGEIVCPLHHARFDLASGKLKAPPALDSLQVYPVKAEGGDVFIGLPEPQVSPTRDRDDRTFVIAGAGAAGNAAAETLRREGFSGRVVMISSENRLPYDRPNLSKDFLSGEAPPEWLPLRKEAFYEKQNIDFLKGRHISKLIPDEHKLLFSDGGTLEYDRILLATGAAPRPLPVPGGDSPHVFVLRSMDDAEAIVRAADKAERAVILGSGFIGLEAAAALRHRNIEVVLATMEPEPMSRVFGERIGKWLRQSHESQGVRFRSGVTVERVEERDSGLKVLLSDGSGLEADFVLVGFGVAPCTDYLEGSGLLIDGAVAVNERMQTRSEDVFAAGDIATFPDLYSGSMLRIEHWVVAEAQGRHAARCMLGGKDPYGEVPFFWTRQYGKSIKYIGHAASYDRVVFRGEISDESFFAGFYLDGRLLATCSLNGGKEFIALGELMRVGNAPGLEHFEDPGFSFIEALSKRK